MRFVLIILVVLGTVGGGYYFYQSRHTLLPGPAAPREIPTALVEPRDIEFVITAAGDIGPADQVSVRMEVNGRISVLPVDIGDQVKKGELLCQLDDRDLQIERDQRLTEISGAKLQIESASLRLEKAQRDYDRAVKLYEERVVAKEEFDNLKTELDAARNQVEVARNNLERAEKALKLVEDRITKTRMLAPFDCTVLTRPVSLGQTVSGAAGFNSGTEIMTIANLNEMVVNAHINQADVVRLQQGQRVEIQVESLPGLKLEGRVERIAPQATIRNNIKGFATRIQIKDMDPRVRPGMTATLTIPVASVTNALAVPLAAVFTEEGQRFVLVQGASGVERRDVNVGIFDYQYAEVQSGLKAGERVLLEMPREGFEELKKASTNTFKASAEGGKGGKGLGGNPGGGPRRGGS
jgi:HlyD family secretion protein